MAEPEGVWGWCAAVVILRSTRYSDNSVDAGIWEEHARGGFNLICMYNAMFRPTTGSVREEDKIHQSQASPALSMPGTSRQLRVLPLSTSSLKARASQS